MKTKNDLENYLREELPQYLKCTDNRAVEYLLTALIRENAVMDLGMSEGVPVKMEFKVINGIPNIARYDVGKNEDIGLLNNLFSLAKTIEGGLWQTSVEEFKEDLSLIEQALTKVLVNANDAGEDLSFMRISGLTYRYYSDTDTETPGALIVTAMVDSEGNIIFKYSTDTAINMAFKDDSMKTSAI